jgi:hypothetical protein
VKKLFVLFVFALIISACDKDKDSSSDTSFRIKSGSLTKLNSPVPGTGTYFDTNLGTGNYAVIYNGVIDGRNYIGIAFSDNPNSSTPTTNIKILFYDYSTIPIGSLSLTAGSNGLVMTNLGANITSNLTLNIVSKNINAHGTTYTTYSLTATSATLTINSGTEAVYAGTITQ